MTKIDLIPVHQIPELPEEVKLKKKISDPNIPERKKRTDAAKYLEIQDEKWMERKAAQDIINTKITLIAQQLLPQETPDEEWEKNVQALDVLESLIKKDVSLQEPNLFKVLITEREKEEQGALSKSNSEILYETTLRRLEKLPQQIQTTENEKTKQIFIEEQALLQKLSNELLKINEEVNVRRRYREIKSNIKIVPEIVDEEKKRFILNKLISDSNLLIKDLQTTENEAIQHKEKRIKGLNAVKSGASKAKDEMEYQQLLRKTGIKPKAVNE